MAKFIELHLWDDRRSLRVDCIISVSETTDSPYVLVEVEGFPEPWRVTETYDEVMSKIKEASDAD